MTTEILPVIFKIVDSRRSGPIYRRIFTYKLPIYFIDCQFKFILNFFHSKLVLSRNTKLWPRMFPSACYLKAGMHIRFHISSGRSSQQHLFERCCFAHIESLFMKKNGRCHRWHQKAGKFNRCPNDLLKYPFSGKNVIIGEDRYE